MSQKRVEALIAQFNGAIKYTPMLADHPDWTDEQCLAFARKWHAVAVKQRGALRGTWNAGIPYCRNVWKEPTGA